MRTPKTPLPRGVLSRLLKGRKRLELLDRKSVVLTMREGPLPEGLRATVEQLAIEAGTLERDLTQLADDVDPATRATVEPMIVHAHALEQRYTEASAPADEH